VRGRVLLKQRVKKWTRFDWIEVIQDKIYLREILILVLSDSMKSRAFLNQLSCYKFVKDFTPWEQKCPNLFSECFALN
jgi:hypothetical protein